MKSSNVGGQAVIEGVMMRSGNKYAIAVRKENQEIEVKIEEYKGFIKSRKLLTIPFIRGVFNFVDSMVLGMKSLTFSASFFELDEETQQAANDLSAAEERKKEKLEKLMMGGTVAFSIVAAIVIFMLLPYFISTFLRKFTDNAFMIAAAEGALRLIIFIGYISVISLLKDIQRVYMYHGAEHKCINCIETGLPLTVENVRKSSKQHKRCGTSFMLLVILISVILFMFIRVDSALLRVGLRILLVPVIAGISYEFIKLAGRSENVIVELLSKPGMWMQNLTTREPDDSMIEVGIASVEAIFDWKEYQDKNFGNSTNAG